MTKFVPKEKLSKKAQRKLASEKRNTWGSINPVTRRIESKKLYNRKKVRQEGNDSYQAEPFILN